jgi:hypothetical protein
VPFTRRLDEVVASIDAIRSATAQPSPADLLAKKRDERRARARREA